MKPTTPRPIWPPLVLPAHISRWIRVRDGLITFLAWVLMAWLIRHELYVLIDYLRPPVFQLTRVSVPNWAKFWAEFGSFIIVSGVLIGWIAAWGIRRRRFLYRIPAGIEPQVLALDEQARFWGLSEQQASTTRQAQIICADFYDDGRLSGWDFAPRDGRGHPS